VTRTLRSATPPDGFRYRSDVLEADEEQSLLDRIRELPLAEFEFHGYLANRRVVSFGFKYQYDERVLRPAEPIPEFLFPLRERAAAFVGRRAEELVQSVVSEYRPGTQIGWHRDKPEFGEVVGVSLASPCTFRFRRRLGDDAWQRFSFRAEPRSMYLLSGAARTDWYHSIPAVEALRYSITFRTLAGRTGP
jgi:alkylated DNA repair dioxygenase AlkB